MPDWSDGIRPHVEEAVVAKKLGISKDELLSRVAVVSYEDYSRTRTCGALDLVVNAQRNRCV